MSPDQTVRPRGSLALIVIALVVTGGAVALTGWRYQAPAPLPADGPEDRFSGERAHQALARVIEPEAPRPVASEANEVARTKLIDELEQLGYEPRIQSGLVSMPFGFFATPKSVIAELPGEEPATILLCAHFDTVRAGPGASDDGMGVATLLEVARWLKKKGPFRNSFLLLFSDGEEAGLLGAKQFVRDDPRAADVVLAINVEARGSGGPSILFETIGPTDRLVESFAARAERPMTSSLAQAVYEAMPNDTDLTAFRHRDPAPAGANFACIGEVEHYHTALDDLAHQDVSTLQHHGDNVLALIGGLADADLETALESREPQPVFFDVLAFRVVMAPPYVLRVMAVVGFILILISIRLGLGRMGLGRSEMWLGILLWPLVLAGAAAAGFATLEVLRGLGAVPDRVPWVAQPIPVVLGGFFGVLLGAALPACWWGGRSGFWGMWSGAWIWMGLASVATAIWLPEGSYLFAIPTAVAGLCGLVSAGRGPYARLLASLLPLLTAALVLIPIAWLFTMAMGFGRVSAFVGPVPLYVALMAPMLAVIEGRYKWEMCIAAALVAFISLGISAVVSPYDEDTPQRLNLVFHQEELDTGGTEARWLVDAYGEPMPDMLDLTLQPLDSPVRFAPWQISPWTPEAWEAEAQPLVKLQAPIFDILEVEAGEKEVVVRGRLRSLRNAPIVRLAMAEGALLRAVVDDQRLEIYQLQGWEILSAIGAPAEGVELHLYVEPGTDLEGFVIDQSDGIAPARRDILDVRPDWCVQSQDGDATIVSQPFRVVIP